MNTHSPHPRVGVAVTALMVALVVAVPSPAAAHDGLVSSSPAVGSTVTTELESVSLTFSDELLDIGDSDGAFAIQVVGPDDLYYNLDCVQRDGAIASTSVALGEAGTYEVTWQVVSSDGHPTSNTFDFVYETPAEAVAAAGAATAPCRPGDSGSSADEGGDSSVAEGGDSSVAEGGDSSEAADETRTVTGIRVFGGGLIAFLVVSAIGVAVMGARSQRSRESRRDQQPE